MTSLPYAPFSSSRGERKLMNHSVVNNPSPKDKDLTTKNTETTEKRKHE
jgi:hypothetical protein